MYENAYEGEIELFTNPIEITKRMRKSGAKYVKDIDVGDLIKFSTILEHQVGGASMYNIYKYDPYEDKFIKVFSTTQNNIGIIVGTAYSNGDRIFDIKETTVEDWRRRHDFSEDFY